MNQVKAILRKELRGFFMSPLALIFIGVFLLATMFTFFWYDAFFNRNIADIRPLFGWLPILLIFLCSAITMHMWTQEQKLGTLEILFTLPVKTHHLVIGKYLAALTLVAVALALTISVPISVSMLGDLDWGPVFGGYFAALLLASAYLSVGLCISALTEDGELALLLSCVVCGFLYAIGRTEVTSNVSGGFAGLLRSLGTGFHFESIRRGVIDLRDLAYYGGVTAAFLAVNVFLLKSKGWSNGARTASKRQTVIATAMLVGLNAIALNILLSPIGSLRMDLTERGEYSVTPVTENLLNDLQEPLLLRGYFSSETHPLLDPMVPRIRDMLEEYAVVADGRVRTEYLDPREDEAVEIEANQSYGIKAFPFRISDRHDDKVVNAYFSILIKYGDQHEVLSFGDLIEVKQSGMQGIEVKLRNLEYDLTRTIKKVAFGFQTVDSLFAELDQPAKFTAYVTPNTLPENFKAAPAAIEKVLKEYKDRAGGKFEYQVLDPDDPNSGITREALYKTHRLKPFAVSLLAQETFYMHMVLQVGDKTTRILPGGEITEAGIKEEVEAALKRAAPGFLKIVGFVKPKDDTPQLPPQMRAQQPPPKPDLTKLVSQKLGENYTVENVELTTGRVDSKIDVLVVFNPIDYDEKQRYAIDQFLMRGGTVVLLAGRYELDAQASHAGVKLKKINSGLEDVLASYGVSVKETLVMDAQNEPFPIPVTRKLGNLPIRELKYIDYPYFVDVRPNGMDKENPVVAGLPAVTMQWASPIKVSAPTAAEGEEAPKREVVTLLESSPKSWSSDKVDVQPNFEVYPDTGFPDPGTLGSEALAVAITGRFDSYFSKNKAPSDAPGSVIKSSPDNARLVVVGSASFINDAVLGISRQTGSDRFMNNLQFVQNLVDWGLEDVDLLTIRSRGTFARTLLPIGARTIEASNEAYEAANYAFAILALIVIAFLTIGRRKRLKPIDLGKASAPTVGKSATEAS